MRRLVIGNEQQGYTLVELLVVIFIVAVMSSVILLRTGTVSFTRDLEHTTRNLHNYLAITQTQAILQASVLGMQVSQQGYQVYEYSESGGGRWQAITGSSFWRPQTIPSGVVLDLFADYKAMPLPQELRDGGPQIIFLPSGELTPFVISLYRENDDDGYEIVGSFSGDIFLRQLE